MAVEINQVLQQRKQDGRDQSGNVGNVQILERMVCVWEYKSNDYISWRWNDETASVCKSGRETEGGGKMAFIFENIWGVIAESNYLENARNEIIG